MNVGVKNINIYIYIIQVNVNLETCTVPHFMKFNFIKIFI